MAGTIINILNRRRFEFSYLAANASQSVILAPAIEACGYGYTAIYARIHERSMTSGQALTLRLFNILPSDEDAREFVETDAFGSAASFLDLSVTSSVPTSVPGICYSSTTSSGPFLKLGLTAMQGTSTSTFYAEISALLHMRETR